MRTFAEKVLRVAAKIPRGKTLSYAQVAERAGIVVACSGIQPWFDRLIAGITADTIVALAHDAYENDEERKKGGDFLS